MDKNWYHIVMMSGWQLRHYELMASDFDIAYGFAMQKDMMDYPDNFTEHPDATVINKKTGLFRNYFHA